MLYAGVNRVNVSVRRCGGGYGSKLGKAGVAAVTSAMAAHLLQRPARVVLSIEENMEAVGKRAGCLFKYEVSTRVFYLKLRKRPTWAVACEFYVFQDLYLHA